MDPIVLDVLLRNLVLVGINAGETITTETSIEKIEEAKNKIEGDLRTAKILILASVN